MDFGELKMEIGTCSQNAPHLRILYIQIYKLFSFILKIRTYTLPFKATTEAILAKWSKKNANLFRKDTKSDKEREKKVSFIDKSKYVGTSIEKQMCEQVMMAG